MLHCPVHLSRTLLTYKVVPSNHPNSELLPTLILVHGRGADENDLLGLVPHLNPRFLTVSVRAPFRYSMGGYTWYDLESVGQPHTGQFVESHTMLLELLEKLAAEYPVDGKRVFLLGFSMGAVMSLALSLTHPSRIRGVVAHSGYLPENTPLQYRWNELGTTSYFLAHGEFDPVIPVQSARRAHMLIAEHTSAVEYHEYPIQHQIGEQSLVDLTSWLDRQAFPFT
jgi:phospholipase/carboxylesterase